MDNSVNPKEIKKFVCLLGCPRSGTTLATALIDAHPMVEMFYEPWNSSKKNPPPIYETPLQFKRKMREKVGSKPNPAAEIVGFKETSEHFEALEWSEKTLNSMSKSCECLLLCLVRDPMHAYLSKIEGAKKYWDNPDAQFTEEGYKDFINQVLKTYKLIGDLSKRCETLIFDYKILVNQPQNILSKIMSSMDLSFDKSQLSYFENSLQQRKVMGDPRVAKNPSGVSLDSLKKREAEASIFQQKLQSDFWNTEQVQKLNHFLDNVREIGITKDISIFEHL
jgi:hypothetical protein